MLVATDVASRGIDVAGITHVIQYDCPDSVEAYVHRCGRTGRAGSAGLVTTFVTKGCRIADQLCARLREAGQVGAVALAMVLNEADDERVPQPVPAALEHLAASLHRSAGGTAAAEE